METITGKLIRLGEGRRHWGWYFDIVEIGDRRLRGVRAPRVVDSVLDIGQEMELRIHKVLFLMKFIVSVRHSNGNHYRTPLYSLLAPSIVFSPMFIIIGAVLVQPAPVLGLAVMALAVLSPLRDFGAWLRA